MRSNHTFAVDFITRKCKEDKSKAFIYARITIDGELPKEICLKDKIKASDWLNKAEKVKGNSIEAKIINDHIDEVRTKIRAQYKLLLQREIKVDWEEVYWQGEFLKKIENIEQLFTAIERSVTMEYDCVTLNKQRIEYSLINTRIWNEIVCFDFENKEPNLIPSKTWKEIYNQPNSDYDYLEHQFKKAQNFLNKHNLKLTPPNDSGQHYDEEVNDYLEQAKSKFIDEPLMMNGILAYEKELDS